MNSDTLSSERLFPAHRGICGSCRKARLDKTDRHRLPRRRIPIRSLVPAIHVATFTSAARAASRATRKAALFLFSVAALLAGGAAVVRGQSALDGFDPNANGAVHVVVV